MRANVLAAALTTMLMMSPGLLGQAPAAGTDLDSIKKVVADYSRLLNAGDAEHIVNVFEPDAVWMPPNRPPFQGREALHKFYQDSFRSQVLDLTFTPVEIQVQGAWAWGRVNITGGTNPKDGRKPFQQDAKTLWVFHRGNDGSWRIARYIYAANKP